MFSSERRETTDERWMRSTSMKRDASTKSADGG